MIDALIKEGMTKLEESGFREPRVEVEALLSGILNCRPTDLYVDCEKELSHLERIAFDEGLDRRMKREPVAYIEGKKNFMGYDFLVDPRVLIPRPETEILVETVLDQIQKKELLHPRILDVGTGSGCIAISVAKRCPTATVVAVDRSPAALGVAQKNAVQLEATNQIRFYLSDIYRGLGPAGEGDFDIIVSNPPYISEPEMSELEPDLAFEPTLALDGGGDGLVVIRPLIDGSPLLLKKSGFLALEIGHAQGASVQSLMKQSGFINSQVIKDYGQKDRVVLGFRNGSI